MPLSDTKIRNAKPLSKAYKLTDFDGLFLLINPSGSKLWRMKYRVLGKEKLLSIGKYPDVSLADARRIKEEARSALAAGRDPGAEKQERKRAEQNRPACISDRTADEATVNRNATFKRPPECLLSDQERTSDGFAQMAALSPKRTYPI